MVSLKDLRKKDQGVRGLTILHQAGRWGAEQSRGEQSPGEQCLAGSFQAEQSRGEQCLVGHSRAEQFRAEQCLAGSFQAEQSLGEQCLIKLCQVRPLLSEALLDWFYLHPAGLRE